MTFKCIEFIRKNISIIIVVLLFACSSDKCISKTEYNDLVDEYAKVKNEYNETRGEYECLYAMIDGAKREIDWCVGYKDVSKKANDFFNKYNDEIGMELWQELMNYVYELEYYQTEELPSISEIDWIALMPVCTFYPDKKEDVIKESEKIIYSKQLMEDKVKEYKSAIQIADEYFNSHGLDKTEQHIGDLMNSIEPFNHYLFVFQKINEHLWNNYNYSSFQDFFDVYPPMYE